MATKACSIFAFFCLLFVLPLLSHAQNSSPFEFLRPLHGYKKGDKVKGIQDLKKYLQHFGYLNPNLNPNPNSESYIDYDLFDDNVESAIKTYQLNFNLKPTGILDTETISKMMMPRCGVADIHNGATRMNAASYKMHQKNHDHDDPSSYHTHYTFFPGTPKWPPTKKVLNYQFLPDTRDDVKQPVADAFLTWSGVTTFFYGFGPKYEDSDIKISFHTLDHGDGHPFDGRGGILAHSFAPTDGRLHFDADENWAVGAVPNAYDMGSIALHEIGHTLGLEHSSVEAAIMYPIMPSGQTKGLNDDDIQGIKALYGN